MINPLSQYTVVKKYSQAEYQLIIVKVGNTYFAIIYIKPNALKSCFTACMKMISENTSRNTVLTGDLNARHTRWDRVSTSQGRWLSTMASKNGWEINAPSEPTFSAHSGHSTVDLIITRNISAQATSVLHGSWDGCSDHFAVQSTIRISEKMQNVQHRSTKIPYSQRSNSKYTRIASVMYKEKLPPLVRCIKNCRDKNTLEDLYRQFKNTILEPWSEARKQKKRRFKYFWNRQLDGMKNQRSRLYRTAKKSGAPNDWDLYHKKDLEIRKIVQSRKRESLEKAADFIHERGMSDGLKIVKSILNENSGSGTQTENSALDPKIFTRHIANIGNSEYTPNITPCELPGNFIERVYKAIKNPLPEKPQVQTKYLMKVFKSTRNYVPKCCVIFGKNVVSSNTA